MWPWRSIHLVKLIEWMRKYNAKHDNILEFIGVDITNICRDMPKDDVAKFVEKAQVKFSELNNKPDQYEDSKYEEESSNFRDKSMFDLFMKLYKDNKKYFILMHNGHVAKKQDFKNMISFGNYMANHFKDNYFVIGNSFNGNSFLAINHEKIAKQIFSLEVSDFKGEIDISKLKYYCGVTDNYYDEINYKEVTDKDLKYKLQNGITWDPKYNKLFKTRLNDNSCYHEMFTIEAGSTMDPDDIYRFLQIYKIKNKFDLVIQLGNDSYLKFD